MQDEKPEQEKQLISRRRFLRTGAAGLGSMIVGGLIDPAAWGASTGSLIRAVPSPVHPSRPKAGSAGHAETSTPIVRPARSVIQLWMSGGPSHLDTFDPKPEAGYDYCGPLNKPVQTNVPGIRISELLPLLARQADKYSIIRSMTHGNDAHETATYIVQTGTLPSTDLVYPAVGAVVSLKKGYGRGYKGLLPPYITLTSPLGRFSEAGFLGVEYITYVTGGEPNGKVFTAEEVALPRNVTDLRVKDRAALLHSLDSLDATRPDDPSLQKMDNFQRQALDLVMGNTREAFDLSQENDDLRNRYGRNHFGQSCLAARRLVEAGVPYITINMGGWDTHVDNFGAMRRLLPVLDAGFATLLDDLSQRGLLETTIVEWIGEFGRTPKISWEPPWNGGRHHHGEVFSAVVAGGGFKGGRVVGASDFRGEKVKDRPVYPWDLSASMYKLLGIDPMGRLPHPQGCVAYVTPLASGTLPSGGMLTEIM